MSHAVRAGPSARGGDHVDVAHRLGAPAQRARLVGLLAGRMRSQRLEHGARELERLVEPEDLLARGRACLELGQELLLLALAEAGLARAGGPRARRSRAPPAS